MSEQDDDCYSCEQETESDECELSERSCGHHCNHSWTHEECCWCGETWD
jgi:hypothetical protein